MPVNNEEINNAHLEAGLPELGSPLHLQQSCFWQAVVSQQLCPTGQAVQRLKPTQNLYCPLEGAVQQCCVLLPTLLLPGGFFGRFAFLGMDGL